MTHTCGIDIRVRIDEASADRRDYLQEITAATWVPMECRAEGSGDYRGVFRASGLGAMQVVVMDVMPISVHRTPKLIEQGIAQTSRPALRRGP